jgi:hypothetical protein
LITQLDAMASPEPEILRGNKRSALFQQLIEKKVILSLYVIGANFEQLTVIKGIEKTLAGETLIIDTPKGFTQAVNGVQPWKLRFNCNGPDRLEYIFSTEGGTFGAEGLKVPFPENVQRLQRRKDFRVMVLPHTKLLFMSGKLKGVMEINNISMGGVFGALVKHNRKSATNSVLGLYQYLNTIAITFPAHGDIEKQVVMIRTARVVRIERHPTKHIDQYALELLDISRDQENRLRNVIYQLQRYYLQNR